MTGRKIGYIRVSTDEQNGDLQKRVLTAEGCKVIYEDDGVSGFAKRKPELIKALKNLEKGDVLVVWKLDRLGRVLLELLLIEKGLREREVVFRSATEAIDTSTAWGRLLFAIIGAVAEYEGGLVSERTKSALITAKEKGRLLGRKRKLSDLALIEAWAEIQAGADMKEVAGRLKVDVSTLSRGFRRLELRN